MKTQPKRTYRENTESAIRLLESGNTRKKQAGKDILLSYADALDEIKTTTYTHKTGKGFGHMKSKCLIKIVWSNGDRRVQVMDEEGHLFFGDMAYLKRLRKPITRTI